MIKHAAIIPLIGGEVIGSSVAFGSDPEYLISYKPFEANESHLLHYYEKKGLNIPYHVIELGDKPKFDNVDVISTVCPCAGLSTYSGTADPTADVNKWIKGVSEYVAETLKPKVFWGENAPSLSKNGGKEIRNFLFETAKNNDYHFSLFYTKSLLHGSPQVRTRTFYFFWRKDVFNGAPIFQYFNRKYTPIEKLLINSSNKKELVPGMDEPINARSVLDGPEVRFFMEIMGLKTWKEVNQYLNEVEVINNVESYIDKHLLKYDFRPIIKWAENNGLEKYKRHYERKLAIYNEKGPKSSFMYRKTTFAKNKIGAFVGALPTTLTHPTKERFITYREAMDIMGLPRDFELLNKKRSVNHICQNVPVITATDMANSIKIALEDKNQIFATEPFIQDNTKRELQFIDYNRQEALL